MVRAGASVLAGGDLVTATPLHWTRRIARRYNQSAELARAVAAEAGLRCDADVIRRVKRTDSQDGKSRAKRERNVAAAFKVPRAAADRVCEKRIVLIDDVLTTGATLTACAHALTAAGAAEVRILVFARVLAARRQTLTAL
ncbi:MAG: phosphoribosyltransferase family protein [Pseudomonadota bacterium]